MRWMVILFQDQFFKAYFRKYAREGEGGSYSLKTASFCIVLFLCLEIPSSILTMDSKNFRNWGHSERIFIIFSHSILEFPLLNQPICWIEYNNNFPAYNSLLHPRDVLKTLLLTELQKWMIFIEPGKMINSSWFIPVSKTNRVFCFFKSIQHNILIIPLL